MMRMSSTFGLSPLLLIVVILALVIGVIVFLSQGKHDDE